MTGRAVLLALAASAAAGCTLFDRELNAGRAYPCSADAGEDPADGGKLPDGGSPQCFVGWRCGRELGKEVPVCHRRGDARAYVCASNAECEGEWTCGVEGLCIPPVDDAFKPGADEDAGHTVERVSQSLLVGTPDVIAAVPEAQVVGGFHGSAMGFVVGDTFTAVMRSRLGPPGLPSVGAFDNQLVRTTRPGGFKDVAGSTALVDQFFALTESGAGYLHIGFTDANMMRFLPDAPYVAAWPAVRQAQLRLFPGPSGAAYAIGDGGIVTELFFPLSGLDWPRDGGLPPEFRSADYPPLARFFDLGVPPVPIARVEDLTVLGFDFGKTVTLLSADGELLYAERLGSLYQASFIDDAGVFHRDATDSGQPEWYPMALVRQTDLILPTGGYVFDDAGYTTGRLRANGTQFAVELARRGTGSRHVLLGQIFYGAPSGGSNALPFATVLLSPCAACPPGFSLTDFRPFIPSGGTTTSTATVEARCSGPGGVQLTFTLAPAVGASGCAAQLIDPVSGPATLADAVLPEESLIGATGWVGGHGQMWLGESLLTAHALFLDGVPAAVVRGGNETAAFKGHTIYFLRDAGYGFIGESGLPDDGIEAVASISGRDDWVLIGEMLVARQTLGGFGSGDELVARPGRSIDPTTLKAPYFGAVAATSDGGRVVVASSNDALFSGDVTPIFFDGSADPGLLEFRHLPVNRVPIRSLAALDAPADGGAYARGYVLAGPNLIEFTASDSETWRSRAVPRPAGEMVEVWSDGDRGRVGYADGRVYSLPGLKLLAPALTSTTVYDYFPFARQPWAIAANGVWRLRAGADAGLGEWYQAEQPPADAGVVYEGARFFEANGALYLFTVHGVAVRFR